MSTSEPGGAATAGHVCHTERCPVEVPPATFMCRSHWSLVPPPLREAIKSTYRAGQEDDKAPSPEYVAIARAAIDAVAHKEARSAPCAPSPRRGKPVQLVLFDLAVGSQS